MELTNDFRVPAPVEEAWRILTDIERIAPCMPGAQLQEVEGDEYRGVVKVKVGPITAQYKGAARFLEQDDVGHRAVLRAEGRDTRGGGNAAATIIASLTPDSEGTSVTVMTDLTVTGKVASFGRGVLADVSAKLLTQFVECLESTVLAAGPPEQLAAVGELAAERSEPLPSAASGPATSGPEPSPPERTAPEPAMAGAGPAERARRIEGPEVRPVDLLETAGGSVAKRVGPVVAVVAVLWLLRQLLRRRKRG
jgi:uncharacterized protein